jgi:NarL family two-component system response regulator LiaR
MKILMVDDNPRIRRMIRSMLESSADEFVECSDGSDAFEAYSTHKPDWVLMDVEMAKMDGIAATKEIIRTFPEARIIIVTNYKDVALQDAAREAGAREYVLKEEIYRVVELIETETG